MTLCFYAIFGDFANHIIPNLLGDAKYSIIATL